MIIAQDIGVKPLNSFSPRDLGQTFEQCRSNPDRMIFVGYHHSDFSDFRVLPDERVVRHTDQPIAVERAKSAPSVCGFGHRADELVEISGVQREPEVSIMVAEVLMQRQRAFAVINCETA